MKKFSAALVFSLTLFGFGFAGHGFAGDQLQYGEMPPPPPLVIQGSLDLVVVPSERYPNQYAYMLPNTVGVYVYEGIWYRNYRGNWFKSFSYNSNWMSIGVSIVPPVILGIPVEYPLYLPKKYHRVHYVEYQSHWKDWERDRHWNQSQWYKHEMREDVRRDRMNHIEQYRAKENYNHSSKHNAKDGYNHPPKYKQDKEHSGQDNHDRQNQKQNKEHSRQDNHNRQNQKQYHEKDDERR